MASNVISSGLGKILWEATKTSFKDTARLTTATSLVYAGQYSMQEVKKLSFFHVKNDKSSEPESPSVKMNCYI